MICISDNELKIVLDIIKKLYPKCRLLAFGSRYRWTNKDYSDLDLAIEGSEKISFEELSKIKDAFEESDLNFGVDIIDLNGISEEFKEIVMSGHEEIYNGMAGVKEGWKKVKLGEFMNIRRGASPRPIREFLCEKGIPWLKISDATSSNSRFIEFTKEFIKENGVNKSLYLKKGSLVLSNSATPGVPKFLKLDACVHDGWLYLSEFKNINQMFLYYLLLNEKNKLISFSNGSVFNNLKTDILREHEVFLPSLKMQEKIASILSSLDDKIELNNEMNKTLEEMVQTLFKRWFIDFEFPNENGEPYKSSDGKMVESELGEIPESWSVKELGELIKFIKGKKPAVISQFKTEETPFKYLTINAFSGNTEGFANKEKTIFVEEDDVLMVMDGASSGVVLNGEEGILGSTLSKIECSISSTLIYFILKQNEGEIRKHTTGTAIPHADKGYISNLKITIPNNTQINNLEKTFKNILEKINLNKSETKELIKIRDLILPRLMCGEIRI